MEGDAADTRGNQSCPGVGSADVEGWMCGAMSAPSSLAMPFLGTPPAGNGSSMTSPLSLSNLLSEVV